MGGKIQLPTGASSKGPQLSYRDDPDRAETASMASAVTLDEYPEDEDLPSYHDVPDIVPQTQHEISFVPPTPICPPISLTMLTCAQVPYHPRRPGIYCL